MKRSTLALGAAVTLAALAAACGKEVREWTPADHDQPANAPPAGAPRRDASTGVSAAAELAELTWGRQCASCHGREGRGDGPQGASVRAADLTRSEFQSRVTDEQLATSIVRGKGRMPSFDLPPPVVAALVARIRAHRTP